MKERRLKVRRTLSLLLLGFALVGNGVDLCFDGSRVANVVLIDNIPVLIKGVCAWNAGWDVDLKNLLGGQVLKLHDKSAEAIAVSRNENALTGFHLWLNLGLKVRPCAGNGVFQALGVRQVFLGNIAEHFLHVRVALITGLKGRWLDVKGAAPNLDLSFAMLGCRVSLVETCLLYTSDAADEL